MKSKPTSIILLFLTAAIWGFAFVAQVSGGSIGTFYFNGIRNIIGAVALIPVVMIFEGKSKNNNKVTVLSGMAAGVILFVAANLQQIGINITQSPGKSGFITALYMFFVPIIASVFLKKRTSKNTIFGAVVAIVGLFFILSGSMTSKDTPLFQAIMRFVVGDKSAGITLSVGYGDIVLLLCAAAFAVHIVFIDYFNNKISPIKFSMVQFFTCGVISLIVAVCTETVTGTEIKNCLVPILYAGIMSTGVAYTLQIIGQKGAHPTISAIILSTESMFAAIGGAMLLGERMSTVAYVGCAVMMVGIIVAQIPSRR